jgi:hypothetical protein
VSHRPNSPRSAARTRAARALGALAAFALCACDPVVYGNGVYREEARGLPAFTGISVDLGILATVEAGKPVDVLVAGDENLLQYVELEVDDAGVLVASASADIRPRIPLRLTARTPYLERALATGASHVEVFDADAPTFTVSASDRSEVHLQGAGGDALVATLSGASHVDARSYHVAGARVTLTGASAADVWVQAPGTLEGELSGASTAQIMGGGTCAVAVHDTSTCDD